MHIYVCLYVRHVEHVIHIYVYTCRDRWLHVSLLYGTEYIYIEQILVFGIEIILKLQYLYKEKLLWNITNSS